MRRFAELYEALDASNSTKAKTTAMVAYFAEAPAEDAAWAVFFLCGDRLRSPVKSRDMNAWAATHAGVTDWMFDACYDAVGDKAETIALLVDAVPNRRIDNPWSPTLAEAVAWIEARRAEAPELQQATLSEAWSRLDTLELFIFNKLMTGALRVGVAKRLVVRALAEWSGVAAHAIFHRLMGHWSPSAESFQALFSSDLSDADASRPYPYFLASPLESEASSLGEARDWLAEWKWDGIRGQLVRRGDEVWLWSRGEELVSGQFPEITAAADKLPNGTVLDGEILAWGDGAPLPFADLQRRIGRKQVGRKLLAEVPCCFMAYDLLELDGEDLRQRPLQARRSRLEALVSERPQFPTTPRGPYPSWPDIHAAP
ncbi:MAG: ATP-dependent DNA ligase, partial [Pseudomonadota bacterium]